MKHLLRSRIWPSFLALALATAALDIHAAAEEPRPAPADTPSLSGRVLGPDGKPVTGATVLVVISAGKDAGKYKPILAKTGSDGLFRLMNIPGETFAARIEAEGMAPFVAREIPAGASITVTLKPGQTLSGRVVDRALGGPIAGAAVEVHAPDAEPFGPEAIRRLSTDPEGRFTVRDLAQGVVRLVAFAPGHARMTLNGVTVPIPPAKDGGPGAEPLLMLGPGGRLAGRVLLPDGKPAARVSVSLRPRGKDVRGLASESIPPELTDPEGSFTFKGVPAGAEYEIQARFKGYPTAENGPYEIEAGTDIRDIEIRLNAGASLQVRVVDAEGKSISDVHLVLETADASAGNAMVGRVSQSVSREQIEAAAEGAHLARALPTGTFDVRIVPPDYDEIERTGVRLRPGETADLGTIVARATRGISGRVTDRAGEPIADAVVDVYYHVAQKGFRSRMARSKPDGRWRLTGLGEGAVARVSARAKGYATATRQRVGSGDAAVDFELERVGIVLGRVLLVEGGSPYACSIRVEPEFPNETSRGYVMFGPDMGAQGSGTFSDPGGYFRLDDVDPGTYTLVARAEGRPPGRRTGIKVTPAGETDVGTIALEEGVTLRGRVLHLAEDTPVAGVYLYESAPEGLLFLRGRADRGSRPSALSGLDGSFSLRGLEPGAHAVIAAHPDLAETEAHVEVPAEGPPAELILRMGRGGRLEGAVRDAAKQPVPNATIALTRGLFTGDVKLTDTGADGRYAFERLAPGGYSVLRATSGPAITLGGMAAHSIAIREGETTVLDFDETPGVQLSGKVLRGSKPVPNAILLFLRDEALMPGSFVNAESGEDGTYAVRLEKGGNYNVHVQTRGSDGDLSGSFAPVPIRVPDAVRAQVDILIPARGISGRVTDTDARPVTEAVLTATPEGGSPTDSVEGAVAGTDLNGSYALEGLRPGTYRVNVAAPGYRGAEAYPVTVADGPTPPVNFILERGRNLHGRVVDPNGRGIPGALVLAAPAGLASSAVLPVTTDVNGVFVITAPSEGPADLTALTSGWAPARAFGVVAGESEEPSIVLKLGHGGGVRVQVVGSQGQPVADIAVSFRATPPFLGSESLPFFNRPQATGPDGVAVLAHLAPGTYEVGVLGRDGARPVSVSVSEGAEASATIRLP